jgi:hypothetical protein
MKRFLASILFVSACLSFAASVVEAAEVGPPNGAAAKPLATTFSADVTGLWLTLGENGWGANIIQQSQTLFVTLFVYGGDNGPTWFVGSNVEYAFTDTSGAYVFSGPLYRTTGPWFATPVYNQNTVVGVPVGTVTIRFTSYSSAQMTYTANGISVTKNIFPFAFRLNNLNGRYLGAAYGAVASCNLPLPQAAASVLGITISQTGTSVVITVTDQTLTSCTLIGTASQYGKLVNIDGNYACTNGGSGAFAIRRLEAGIDGLSGAYVTLSNSLCSAQEATIGAARVSF